MSEATPLLRGEWINCTGFKRLLCNALQCAYSTESESVTVEVGGLPV